MLIAFIPYDQGHGNHRPTCTRLMRLAKKFTLTLDSYIDESICIITCVRFYTERERGLGGGGGTTGTGQRCKLVLLIGGKKKTTE